jgi:N-acetylmuramate 1-kinase
MTLEQALARWIQSVAGPGETAVEPMPGGASTRRFFRVGLGERGSAVAMYVPDATRSDEIAKSGEPAQRWPFLEVRDLLEERGVHVPRLLGEACDDGFILVEDLGDDTLAQFIARAPEQREPLYRAAVRDLARAQRSLAELPSGSVVATRAFDEDLLRWEVDHFREWGLEARGVELSDADRAIFSGAADHLARTIAGWPRGFVHRDYQSRNLMVRPGDNGSPELVWIDFQDAPLGPRVYDLVALLSDSYQTFDREFVERRLDEYAAHLGLDAAGRAEVGREFELVSVQRKLKDAGRFVFIDRVRKNPHFLQFVDPTIGKVRAALGRLAGDPVLDRLAELLGRVLPG